MVLERYFKVMNVYKYIRLTVTVAKTSLKDTSVGVDVDGGDDDDDDELLLSNELALASNCALLM